MTRIKLLFLSLLMTTMAMAQKEFTLEDLNYGGVNYHRMSPENRFLTWWGDELVRTEAGYCNIVNKKTGAVTLKTGLKKGTYKLKLKVTASGNGNYKKLVKTVKVKIKVG